MEHVRRHWPSEAAALEGVDDLKEALRRADEALVRDDHAAALDAAAPELLANVPGGLIIDKAVFTQALAHNMISYERYERWVERAASRSNGEVVLMGAEEVVPKASHARFNEGVERRRFTEVWWREEGRWVLSLRHAGPSG